MAVGEVHPCFEGRPPRRGGLLPPIEVGCQFEGQLFFELATCALRYMVERPWTKGSRPRGAMADTAVCELFERTGHERGRAKPAKR